jgi:uncharacterized protein YciI
VSTVPPVRREILLEADPGTAFEVFTTRIGAWWPLAELSVYGAGATVAFTDGQIIERSADGTEAVWGTVTRWEPPGAVAFTWHPGKSADRASHVEVTFAVAADQTLVTLEHTGWDVFADPAAARDEYDHGWPMVLDRYRDYFDSEPDSDGETWIALMHRPGPAAGEGTVFEDPRFAEHVAFLSRMRDAGYLVAAGPLADADGEGMTIVRLPGSGRLADGTRLATEDDLSVVSGLLAVTVRPWHVIMHTAGAGLT